MKLFLSGVNDSLTLLAFRFRSSKPYMKVLGVFGLIIAFISIYMTLFTNGFIRSIMSVELSDSPTSATAREMQHFISIFLEMYSSNDMLTFVSAAVILMLGSVLFVPFSGYVIHGVVSHSEMVTIKSNDNYRIGDSLVFQIVSSFTLIQLAGLTVTSQLMTFDRPHSAYAVLFAWCVWGLVTLITVLFSWSVEFITRKYGKNMKLAFIGLFLLAFAAALIVDPNHGFTLFGAADPILKFMQALGDGNLTLLLSSIAVIIVLSVIVMAFIGRVAEAALTLPEPATVTNNETKKLKESTKPLTAFGLFSKMLFRYPTATKPVATAVAFSIVFVLLLRGLGGISTVMIVLPLAVGIAYGANVFGLVSGANNWLLSVPNWRSRMFFAGSALIAASVTVVYVLVLGLGIAVGSVTMEEFGKALPSLITITFAATLVSMWLSIKKPLAFSGKARENIISSPITLITHVLVFLFTVGSAGNIVFYAAAEYQWSIAFTLSAVIVALYFALYTAWMKQEKHVTRVLQNTINAG